MRPSLLLALPVSTLGLGAALGPDPVTRVLCAFGATVALGYALYLITTWGKPHPLDHPYRPCTCGHTTLAHRWAPRVLWICGHPGCKCRRFTLAPFPGIASITVTPADARDILSQIPHGRPVDPKAVTRIADRLRRDWRR
jgi:hypothetical protein